jgi:hypothetical protein
VVLGRVLGISLGPILGEEEGNADIDRLYMKDDWMGQCSVKVDH